MNRRELLRRGGAGLVALGAYPGGAAGAAAPVLREPRCGPIRGTSDGTVARFFGIPFARPPLDALRFRAPEPAARWREPLAARAYAPSPVQPGSPPEDPSAPLPTSEDCLYLNVWAPERPGPHPVQVWVHGGGNVTGSTRFPVFDGSGFARAGVVCVTITYRTGCWGFLDLEEALGGSYADSGNNGLRDQIMALRWVHDNIAAFGGDPARVTLAGQSAGAKDVVSLLAAPAARGLFARAIVESGGGQTIADRTRAAELTRRVAAAAGVAPAALRDLPARALLAAQTAVVAAYPRKYPFRAVVGGALLPQAPLAAIAAGAARDVPLLLGWNRDEVAFWGPPEPGAEAVRAGELANLDLATFAPVYARYAALVPDPLARRYAAVSAEEYGIPTIRLAAAQARAGGVAHLYRFDLPLTTGARRGYAIHGAELPLTWARLDDPASTVYGPVGTSAERLSAAMHGMWLRFLRGGAPAANWPSYDLRRRATMRLDALPRVVDDLAGAERLLWDGVL
ncbi:carboxylesterase/lipase family protein [Sphingomonas phyllosphaerae]|uniref:carboxylesterase/lipase family protein n=1 Tax=Sphingomonas phyllosphaerae TaxID=257003 RepID=UPI002413A666|nr:carboxylesterase family protein [Sphingomonas phyllosphaerae]